MHRIIKTDFYKIVTGYGMYLCVLFTIILCFGTSIHIDMMNNDQYSVIRSLISFDREFMLSSYDFISINVALKGAGSWLSMFIPIISAFAYIPLVCDESESKSIRYAVFRSSKLKFYLSRFITAVLSGGFAVMIGYMVFCGIVFILFPNIGEFPAETREFYIQYLSDVYPSTADFGIGSALVIKFAEIFVYGAIAAIPSILLTAVSKNKYVVLCIPFFIKYALTQTSVKLIAQAYSNGEGVGGKLTDISNVINLDYVLQIYEMKGYKLIAVYIIVAISTLALYLFIQLRRFDSGE